MITPNIFEDVEFISKLNRHKSQGLDDCIDKIIESLDETFISQCDGFPQPEKLNQMNIARISVFRCLQQFKTNQSLTNNEEI